MLIFSILLHSTYPSIVRWPSKRQEAAFKAAYTIGYALTGIYGVWLIVFLVFTKLKARAITTNSENPFASAV
jgi:hypothetical protein